MDIAGKETGAKKKIIDAARSIFAEHGYHGASMKDISQEAKVNKALLFYYFSSKENLYREVILSIHDETYNNIVSQIEGITGIREKFECAIKAYVSHFQIGRDIVKIIAREIIGLGSGTPLPIREMMHKMTQPLVGILSEGMEKGIFARIDPEFAAIAILGMLQMFFKAPCSVLEYDNETISKNLMQILDKGILAGANTL